jgi:hypothetical protein
MKRRVKIGKLSRNGTDVYQSAISRCNIAHMDQTGDPASRLSKPAATAIAAGMLAFGLIMVLHGLGIAPAQWLNPNPLTPHWIFTLIGAILILSAWLTLGTAYKIPKTAINVAGYSTIALSLVGAHWLIFFSQGGRCEAGTGTLSMLLPGLFCATIMGIALIGLDLILIIVAVASLRPCLRG